MMEITKTLVFLEGLQPLTAEQASGACKLYLSERYFELHPTMLSALSEVLAVLIEEIKTKVLHQFEEADFEVQTTVADWLHIRGISCHEYTRKIKSSKFKVDSLFIWLAVTSAK